MTKEYVSSADAAARWYRVIAAETPVGEIKTIEADGKVIVIHGTLEGTGNAHHS